MVRSKIPSLKGHLVQAAPARFEDLLKALGDLVLSLYDAQETVKDHTEHAQEMAKIVGGGRYRVEQGILDISPVKDDVEVDYKRIVEKVLSPERVEHYVKKGYVLRRNRYSISLNCEDYVRSQRAKERELASENIYNIWEDFIPDD